MYHTSLYDEEKLLLQIAQGNERAFRILFDQHHQRLGKHVFKLTRSHEMAEEVVQDVFLKIWVNRESLIQIQNFKAYLYVVSKNLAFNCLREVARERVAMTQLDQPDNQGYYEEYADDNERYLLFDEAIDHLPPQQQRVYLMSRHGRLKQSQIAEELNLSTETVKKYLKIASESIRGYVRKKLISSLLMTFFYFF